MKDNNIIFNVIDWKESDIINIDDIDQEEGITEVGKYTIELYGRTEDDKSVYVKVLDYTPYFYIEIPQEWKQKQLDRLVEYLKEKLGRRYRDSLIEWNVMQKYKFYGFTNNKLLNYGRLIFDSSIAMKKCSYIFNNKINIPNFIKDWTFRLYESNIVPLLRCMHIRDLKSCGWISIDEYTKVEDDDLNSDIKIETEWVNLNPIEKNIFAPFKICSFDIECTSSDGGFPMAKRPEDKIIMIGSTFSRYGNQECYYKNIIVLGSCDPIDGVDVECYDSEEEVLIAWMKLIQRENPDIITGYNIFGFDEVYIKDRVQLLGITEEFSTLGKFMNKECEFLETDLSSSALGDNKMKYYDMIGRIQVDLLKVVQRDHKLASYKLDAVAENFIKGQIINNDNISFSAKNTEVLKVGNYITFEEDEAKYMDGKKFRITEINNNIITLNEEINFGVDKHYKWGLVKDDLKPSKLFELFKGSSADRKIIAEYCIQDCALCNRLLAKLEILTNNMAMAIVCNVPLSYIFFRGQGIKIFSLVAKKCRLENYVIPVLKYKNDGSIDDSYQGAVVFEPKAGYYHDPIPVTDYGSLYPSSMIHKNLSHETIVIGTKVNNKIYDNLPEYNYYNVTYYNNDGKETTCRYAKPKNGKLGILPQILQQLLGERKATRKKQETEKDPSKWAILEGLQLAFKITANSLYGQCGASTSPICMKDIAASTTAIGRDMLEFCKIFVEKVFKYLLTEFLNKRCNEEEILKYLNDKLEYQIYNYISNEPSKFVEYYKKTIDTINKFDQFIEKYNISCNESDIYNDKYIIKYVKLYADENNISYDKSLDDKKIKGVLYNLYDSLLLSMVRHYILNKNIDINPEIIYGDTDSNFINMRLYDKINKVKIQSKEGVPICIELGKLVGRFILPLLPSPQTLNYEKTLYPFCIMSKKRYVGNMYEMKPDEFHLKYMGIVLKRRDNANIVKKVISGIIDIMMNSSNVSIIPELVKKNIEDILTGKYPIEDFIITKTLKANYVDRTKIAHVCLADKRAIRDPGNKPQLNDRIPYIYVEKKQKKGKKLLQGDIVEDPEYAIENKLPIDYLFYLTNQIMKPALQLLEFVIPNAENIFNKFIEKENNRRNGIQDLNKWITPNTKIMTDDDDDMIIKKPIPKPVLLKKN